VRRLQCGGAAELDRLASSLNDGCDMPWVDLSDNDPGRVDQAIRMAIHKCWHALPEEQQTIEVVERLFRRMVDRAFRDMREDAELFVQAVIDGQFSDDGGDA
jgi:hypothetical protein